MNFQTAMKETVENWSTSTLSHGMSWPIEAWDFGGTTLEASGNSSVHQPTAEHLSAPCTRVDFWTMQHGATKLHVHVQFLCPCLSCGNKLLQKKTKHHLPICFSRSPSILNLLVCTILVFCTIFWGLFQIFHRQGSFARRFKHWSTHKSSPQWPARRPHREKP